MAPKAAIKSSGRLAMFWANTCPAPAGLPWMDAGMPRSCMALVMADWATLNEPPGGKLNEIVDATMPFW